MALTCVQRVVKFVIRRHTPDTVGARLFQVSWTLYMFGERYNISWVFLTLCCENILNMHNTLS